MIINSFEEEARCYNSSKRLTGELLFLKCNNNLSHIKYSLVDSYGDVSSWFIITYWIMFIILFETGRRWRRRAQKNSAHIWCATRKATSASGNIWLLWERWLSNNSLSSLAIDVISCKAATWSRNKCLFSNLSFPKFLSLSSFRIERIKMLYKAMSLPQNFEMFSHVLFSALETQLRDPRALSRKWETLTVKWSTQNDFYNFHHHKVLFVERRLTSNKRSSVFSSVSSTDAFDSLK